MNTTPEIKQKVADVLAGWNPIGVPLFLAREEYQSYVEPIIVIGNNRENLIAYLKELVTGTFGLPYDERNFEHEADIAKVVKELLKVFEAAR
jgi:hypothetical protein